MKPPSERNERGVLNEPLRLRDDPARRNLDRAILRSADGDGPSARARVATQLALGLGTGAAIAGAAGAKAGAATATTATAAKVGATASLLKVGIAVVAISTVVAAGTVVRSTFTRATTPTVGSAVVRQPAPPRMTPRVAEATTRESAAESVPAISVDALPSAKVVPSTALRKSGAESKPVASAEPPPGFAERPSSDDANASLSDEIASLDRARTQLANGQPRRAIDELLEYRRAHPSGTLAGESQALLADAYLAAGDKEGARREATAYLSRYPSSPPATRLRKMLEDNP